MVEQANKTSKKIRQMKYIRSSRVYSRNHWSQSHYHHYTKLHGSKVAGIRSKHVQYDTVQNHS